MIIFFFNTDHDLLFGLLCYLQKRSENDAQIQRRMRMTFVWIWNCYDTLKKWENWGGNVPNDLLYRFGSDEICCCFSKKRKREWEELWDEGLMSMLKPKARFLKQQGTGTEIYLGISIKFLEKLAFYSNVLCVLMFFFLFALFAVN